MKNSIYVKLICLLMVSALILMPTRLASKIHSQAAQANTLTDASELEAFLNPLFAEQMEKLHIPGAAIGVVKDGKIFFSKGYGYANLEKKTPATADKTIFPNRLYYESFYGNFISAAAERRKINLNDDVNKYLKVFKIQNNYPQPVTFANLLTHTAGFDEINLGRKTTSADKVIPLGEFLKARLIRRKPPGEFISYSTYGICLAGHLVETISGAPYKEYLKKMSFNRLE